MDLNKIQEEVEKNEYSMIGIRSDDRIYQVNDLLEKSHDWDFEHDCSSETLLDGTCALSDHLWMLDDITDDEDAQTLETLVKKSAIYGGSHCYLIGGDGYTQGDDSHEVIIHNARVIAVIR
jgi:hypothetical protein